MADCRILLETGDALLLEDGGDLLIDGCAATETTADLVAIGVAVLPATSRLSAPKRRRSGGAGRTYFVEPSPPTQPYVALAPTTRIVVSALAATSAGRYETRAAAFSVSIVALGAESERRPSRVQLADEADLLGLGSA